MKITFLAKIFYGGYFANTLAKTKKTGTPNGLACQLLRAGYWQRASAQMSDAF